MSAPQLSHPFRLVESVYNNAQFDCSLNSTAPNISCHNCMELTLNVREDLVNETNRMLKDEHGKFLRTCLSYISDADSRYKAKREIYYKMRQTCELEHDIANLVVDAVHKCY